jgi:hypothetical protein
MSRENLLRMSVMSITDYFLDVGADSHQFVELMIPNLNELIQFLTKKNEKESNQIHN